MMNPVEQELHPLKDFTQEMSLAKLLSTIRVLKRITVNAKSFQDSPNLYFVRVFDPDVFREHIQYFSF